MKINCSECGKAFEAFPSAKRKYCSKKCAGVRFSIRTKGVSKPHYRADNNPNFGGRHGHARGYTVSSTYISWRNMLARCTNSNDKDWANYGGRGIRVDSAWLSFDAFLRDMGERPSTQYTIDRIDNDGNYEPGNCRWATKRTQGRNSRACKRVTFNDQSMSVVEWSERTGIPTNVLYLRFRNGWSAERALTEPVHYKRKPSAENTHE